MTAHSIALFGARRPTLSHRAPGSGARRFRAACTRTGRQHGRRWDDRGVGEPGLAQLRLVEGRHGDAEGGARGQLAELCLRQQLMTRHAVVPWRVELRRGHVVVVDDEGLGTGAEPGGDGRCRGELVDQHVPGFGLVRVAGERPRRRRRVGVGHLHVDLRRDPASSSTSCSRSVCRPTASERCSIGTNWWTPLTRSRPPSGPAVPAGR